jgi:hypothetical protein
MSIVLQSTGGGSVTINEPTTASNFTQTLPAATGTVMVSGNMPAFSAYQSSSQTISNNTVTKIQFQTEEFDTANAFDNTTNYRFTPQVAGYYQVNCGIGNSSGFGNGVEVLFGIAKNGGIVKYVWDITSNIAIMNGTALIYMNGSTDYLEIYFAQYSGSSKTINANSQVTYFQASMVRSA